MAQTGDNVRAPAGSQGLEAVATSPLNTTKLPVEETASVDLMMRGLDPIKNVSIIDERSTSPLSPRALPAGADDGGDAPSTASFPDRNPFVLLEPRRLSNPYLARVALLLYVAALLLDG